MPHVGRNAQPMERNGAYAFRGERNNSYLQFDARNVDTRRDQRCLMDNNRTLLQPNDRLNNYYNRPLNTGNFRQNNYNNNNRLNNFSYQPLGPRRDMDRHPYNNKQNDRNNFADRTRDFDRSPRGQVVNGYYRSFEYRRNNENIYAPYNRRSPYRDSRNDMPRTDTRLDNPPNGANNPPALQNDTPTASAPRESITPLNS